MTTFRTAFETSEQVGVWVSVVVLVLMAAVFVVAAYLDRTRAGEMGRDLSRLPGRHRHGSR